MLLDEIDHPEEVIGVINTFVKNGNTQRRYIISTPGWLCNVYLTSSLDKGVYRVIYSLNEAFDIHFYRLSSESFITE